MERRREGEMVVALYDREPTGHAGRLEWRERVVRCRDCAHCREFPQGAVCTLRGAAGWFATEPEGFCWLGKERP